MCLECNFASIAGLGFFSLSKNIEIVVLKYSMYNVRTYT
jgi:hypothetical protein